MHQIGWVLMVLGIGTSLSQSASAQVRLETARVWEQRVEHRVSAFRNPTERPAEVVYVGLFIDGYVSGLLVGQPDWADSVERCFGGWTVQQRGEWLLQYWEESPELWDKDWKLAAIVRTLETLSADPGC